jgi:alkylation response protein AidB-like acyl-CoA dehydrogenase
MSFLAYPATEQQKKLCTIAGELADVFAKRAAEGDWEGRFPLENFDDLRRAGYLTLTVPRELGGWGASLLDVVLAQFRLAQGDASTALAVSMHFTNVMRLIEELPSDDQALQQICHAVVEKGALLNLAASEPATGSPSRGGRPTTTARRQPDGSWIINGRKTFTTGSYALHFIIVSCAIEDDSGDAGLPPLSADRGNFLLTNDAPGLRIENTWNSLGMRGSGSNDLILENVHVGPEAHLNARMSQDPAAQGRLAAWGFPTTAVYLGIAQAARDEAISFARRRRPNSLNQPISTIPHIQDKVAKMDLALIQSKAVFFGVAEQFSTDASKVTNGDLAAAKYVVTNHAVEIVDLAMRLVGGASLSLNFPLQRYYRDVRAGLHHPPMDDSTLALLAKRALEG